MNVNHDLDKLEKKTASVIYQDGIFDMTLGLVLIVYGIATILYYKWPETWVVLSLFLIYAVFATPLFLIQVFVTKPRIGVVKPKPKRKKKRLGMIIFTSILFAANIVIFIVVGQGLVSIPAINKYVITALFGVVPIFIFALMAYFMDFPRLYIIGVLFGIGVFLMQLFLILDMDLIGQISVMGIGLIIIAIGAVYLFRFLKKYPKLGGQDYEFQRSKG